MFTYILGESIGPIFKTQAVQDFQQLPIYAKQQPRKHNLSSNYYF